MVQPSASARIYWATGGGGSAYELQRSGNSASIVATIGLQSLPRAITIDANAVYWTKENDGTVMRLTR